MRLIEFVFCFVFASTLSTEVLLSERCGIRVHSDQQSVDNGHATATMGDEEHWPWVAAIYRTDSDGLTFKCAGTLINSSLVLTSARCMFDTDAQIAPRTIEVHLGQMNLGMTELDKSQKFAVDEIIVHPGFAASNYANNLAIVRLSAEANLTNFVQPVCLRNSTETAKIKAELGTVVGWGIIQVTTDTIPDTVQDAAMTIVANANCLNGGSGLPDGTFCAVNRFGMRSDSASSGASMIFKDNDVYRLLGIMSENVRTEGHTNEYAILTDVVKFISWIQETESAGNGPTTPEPQHPVCRPNEEFVYDPYRCDETCEEYGNPICVEYTPEAKCFCKKGFIRLKTVGICVTADNRACRAKMPPTEEICARKQNERLSEWLYDEPCANTCENYNVPCNVSVPDGMFWGPHCICEEGFSRLPNRKCVAVDDPKCKEFWNPTPSTTTPSPPTSTTVPTLTPCKDFCGNSIGSRPVCSQFDLGMQYSSAGTINGKFCTQMLEVADPHTWHDNYICFNKEYGVRWSSAGQIAGMTCTQIVEVADPHTWHDNFLCVPYGSPFRFQWSSHHSISGLCCVQIHESVEPLGHTWDDNYLCVSE
ncbi:uncharacterized protein LOC119075146 [Bradysia coprophila]|uniref:uncharacterized protein LOC119075146 n=1 Tax=Bradysia coprophila TaxID=38358 RepID=UPI00187DA042|nr:uncharacterized protein LOC119075146 [Bradysia coprophila]